MLELSNATKSRATASYCAWTAGELLDENKRMSFNGRSIARICERSCGVTVVFSRRLAISTMRSSISCASTTQKVCDGQISINPVIYGWLRDGGRERERERERDCGVPESVQSRKCCQGHCSSLQTPWSSKRHRIFVGSILVAMVDSDNSGPV